MKSTFSIKIALTWLIALAIKPVFAETQAIPMTQIKDIRCEGAQRTSCEDLIAKLSLIRDRAYSSDELNSIKTKLGELSYYKSYQVRLEPLNKAGHANLILILEEVKTSRHAINGKFGLSDSADSSKSGLVVHSGYAYSDHNLFGKGYFFQGSASVSLYDSALKMRYVNLEIAGPMAPLWFWTGRIMSNPTGQGRIYALGGLGYQLSENSLITGYIGNHLGGNFTYHTEDHGLIPMTGSLFSLTVLSTSSALDARTHWQAGRWDDRQGVITASLQFNSPLNPAFRTFAESTPNTTLPETGITYSLVKNGANGQRSAYYFGIINGGFANTFSISAGYKASIEDFDVNLGVLFLADKQRGQ